uniref:BZIP transcription factor n=1 Tax=Lilium hybrid cultivar TaxID=156531 RepID=A0A6J4D0D4_9LILI|nr:bZIP transcription factor [Lilium hybrid cultivar]
MWSSHPYHRPLSSSSTFSSSSSRTMDDVWMDITLTSPHHDRLVTPSSSSDHYPHRPIPTTTPSFRSIILQDFLTARAFKKAASATVEEFPAPTTALSLQSGMDVHCYTCSNSTSNSDCSLPPQQHDDDTFPSPGLFYLKKRATESLENDGDRRQKRMIKNRESASRSRARKQAYTNELEQEVARLMEENERLKKKCSELRLAMADQQHPKNTLERTLSAPF